MNTTTTTFNELGLSSEIMQAVEAMGFTTPSPIQAASIPVLLAGNDIIGQAKTGTGKTAAFGIPVIEAIEPNTGTVQALIMCPTRELAMQVSEEIIKLSKFKRGIRVLAVYGGSSMFNQIKDLKRGVEIVVGTPGRIMDHMERRTLNLSHIKQVVLDEADEMLNMGFRDDIEHILSQTPAARQTIFFSATMPKPILDLTRKYLNNPQHVAIAGKELTVNAIEQRYFEIKEKDKLVATTRLIDIHAPKLTLVFSNMKVKVDEIVTGLNQAGYKAESLHGDMAQAARTKVMGAFRSGRVKILVATDVAARGIDVDDIDMVINYDIPLDTEYYVHRIGRTGRAGREGKAYSLVTPRDRGAIREIERFAKITIEKGNFPTSREVAEKKKEGFFKSIITTIDAGKLTQYVTWEEELINLGYSKVDIAAALMKMSFERDFPMLGANSEIETSHSSGREREERGGDRDRGRGFGSDRGGRDNRPSSRQSGERSGFGGRSNNSNGGNERADRGRSSFNDNSNMKRLFINLGRNEKISPRDVVGAIAGECGLSGKSIGDIDIYDKFTFVNVPESDAKRVIQIMGKSNIKGNKLRITFAEDSKVQIK